MAEKNENISEVSQITSKPILYLEEYSNYCYCAVPCCNSDTKNTPLKKFVCVPFHSDDRKAWLKLAGIKLYVSTSPHIYFCEDHFSKNRNGQCFGLPNKFQCQYFRDEHLSTVFGPELKNVTVPPSLLVTEPYKQILIKKTNNVKQIDTSLLEPEECADPVLVSPDTPDVVLSLSPTSKMTKPVILKRKDPCFANPILTGILSKKTEFPMTKNKVIKSITNEHNYAKEPLRNDMKLSDNFFRLNKINAAMEDDDEPYKRKKVKGEQDNEDEEECYQQHNEEEHNVQNNSQSSGDTDSTESFTIFKCDYCIMEFHHKYDLLNHIQEEHMDIEVPLDIKPEIFQCSKCPSSFVNEEDMSKHLQIMHGDLMYLNKQIKMLKRDKRHSHQRKDINYLNYDEHNAGSFVSLNSHFVDLQTSVEVKRENSDIFEDIDLSIESKEIDDLISDIYQKFDSNVFDEDCTALDFANNFVETCGLGENKYSFTDTATNEKTRMMVEQDNESTLSAGSFKTYQCSYCRTEFVEYSNLMLHIQVKHARPENIKCRTCHRIFVSEEELLDHMHELVNTKAQLYANAKKLLKADRVNFKRPLSSFGKKRSEFLNDAELLDSIHRIYYSKPEKKDIKLEIVADISMLDDKDPPDSLQEPYFCSYCFILLSNESMFKNENLCTKCMRIEKETEKNKKTTKTRLYASAKEVQFNQRADRKSYNTKPNTATLNKEALLDNVHKVFNKSLKKQSVNKILEEANLEDNSLLTPLREEDEQVIVALNRLPCKTCQKPLQSTCDQSNAVCRKCTSLKTSNARQGRFDDDKRRKSIEIKKNCSRKRKVKQQKGKRRLN